MPRSRTRRRYDTARHEEQLKHLEALASHHKQFEAWAENCPENFANRAALLAAEIARIEDRSLAAMHFYEQAIQSARDNGFVHNEGLANEAAARFYLADGFETIAHVYLRNARNCYERWGALGKVKQLDTLYPQLRQEQIPTSSAATIGTALRQLDLETVVKSSQALSSEIVLPRLIERLMQIAVEHAGAGRGLLILLRDDKPQIEAEATIRNAGIDVNVQQAAVTHSDLPQSALQYVIRTQERVVLDDASLPNMYSEDEYVRGQRPRSVLCLPIVKQTKLVGALYLENNLTPFAFTSDRIAVLELLASQAAISLENARLYSDMQRSEAYLAQGQSISHTGSFGWNKANGDLYWSEETNNIFERDRTATLTMDWVYGRMHPEDRGWVRQGLERAVAEKTGFDIEHRLQMPDGRIKHVRAVARVLETSPGTVEFVGTVVDTTAATLAGMKLRESEAYLAEAQRLSHTGSWAWSPATGENRYWSDECFRLLGFDPAEGMPLFETFVKRILWLQRLRKIAYLIQEERALIGHFEAANSLTDGSRERAFFMAK